MNLVRLTDFHCVHTSNKDFLGQKLFCSLLNTLSIHTDTIQSKIHVFHFWLAEYMNLIYSTAHTSNKVFLGQLLFCCACLTIFTKLVIAINNNDKKDYHFGNDLSLWIHTDTILSKIHVFHFWVAEYIHLIYLTVHTSHKELFLMMRHSFCSTLNDIKNV